MDILLMGLGLVLIFEGLVVALLPKRLDDILKMLNDMPIETRRTLGLGAMAAGLVLLWLTKG
jgi:uncharacterized protein YjeT (DUF2065 family)